MSLCNRRHSLLGAAALLLVVGVGTALAQDKKPVPLKIGVLKMAALTNAWIAKTEGMFEKNGLDVTLVEFKSGGEAISAQQSGSVDIILSIPGTAMSAIERGFDLVAIMQNEIAHDKGPDSGSIQVLASSDMKSLADLKGKKLAVSALHTQQTVSVQVALKRAGVDLKSVQFLEVPYPSQADALRSKQVDAVSPVDPYTTQLVASGVGRVISWMYAETIPGMPLGAWFTKTATIKKNPQAIEAFTRSIKESIDYLNADENRARDKVVAYTGLNPELVRDMPAVAWDYRVRPEKWQAVADMMQENGELDKKHKAEEFFSDQIKAYIVK